MVRLDREEAPPPDGAGGAPAARLGARASCARADVLVVSDYGKGTIGPALLDALAEAHARRPFTWVVDPKRANFPHYRRASLVKPNREEAAAAAGIEIRDAASPARGGRAPARALGGRGGADLARRGRAWRSSGRGATRVREFPTAAREVFDVTGAGDTVVATCALALGAGAHPRGGDRARQPRRRHRRRQGRHGDGRRAAELAAAVRDG